MVSKLTSYNTEPGPGELIIRLGYSWGQGTDVIGVRIVDINSVEELNKALDLASAKIFKDFSLRDKAATAGLKVFRGGTITDETGKVLTELELNSRLYG